MIVSYQSNNIGQNVGQQIRMFSVEDILTPFEKDLSKKNWVRIVPMAPPTFSDTRWLDNNAHLGTINFLKKLSKNYELRVNLSYLNDHQRQVGSTQTLSFLPTDTIEITENKRNQLIFNTLEGSLTLERNDRGHYLSNQLSFKRQWDQETGVLALNGSPLNQHVSSPYYGISNHLKDVFKVKKRVVTVQSFLRMQNTPQRLSVSPGPFEVFINDSQPYQKLIQEINVRSFFTHQMLSFTRALGRGFSISPQVGVQFENQHLGSQLLQMTDLGVTQLPGSGLANTLDWRYFQAYAKLRTQYKKDKWQVSLTTPLALYDFSTTDQPLQAGQKRRQLTFEPQLSATYELSSHLNISGALSRQNQFGKMEDVFYGYLLRTYRTIERRDAPLPANLSQGGNLGISYRNPVSSVFGHLIASRRAVWNNVLYSTRLNANGAAESIALASFNRSINELLSGQISKYVFPLKTTIGLDGQFSRMLRPQLLNDVLTDVKNQTLTTGIRLNGNPLKWADWEYRYQRLHFVNIINQQPTAPTRQQQHQLNLGFYPISRTYISFKNEFYVNRLIAQQNTNLFSDLIVRYTLPKQKIDFETSLNNLWNSSELTLINTNAFSYIESNYQLRPRQFIQRVRFSF